MIEDSSPVILRSAKCWQTKNNIIVWQVSTSFATKEIVSLKKFFLVCDANQKNRGFRLAAKKPDGLFGQGSIINLLRKHAKSCAIGRPLIDKEKNMWLPMYTSKNEAPDAYILLTNDQPPQLQLILSDKTVLIRQSSKGTYTKKKTFEGDLPHDLSLYTDFSEELFSVAELTPEAKEKAPSSDEQQIFSDFQREARKRLARRIKTVKKSISKIEKDTANDEQIDLLERNAVLAKSHSYLLKDGMESLSLSPEVTGLEEPIELALDPDLKIGQNIVALFDKAKKAKRSQEVGEKKIKSSRKNLSSMETDLEVITSKPLSDGDIEILLTRHKLPLKQKQITASKTTNEASPYKCFASSDGVPILVGKGPEQNDEMTKKARSNDHWFHVVGVHGSHVIIRARDGGKELSEKLKREASILALHFSKLREDHSGEVYFAAKSGIRKQKNMPAGLWLVDRADTLFVKYSDTDLKPILDRYMPDGK